MDYLVIKENDLFLLSNKNGDIEAGNPHGHGLYSKDTRFLSQFGLLINGKKPILLISEDDRNYYSTVLLTNPHMEHNGDIELWRESIQIKRERFIHADILYEKINLTNFSPKTVSFSLSILFDADFADMFIVRGYQNGTVGRKTGSIIGDRQVIIGYEGADQINRATKIIWDMDAISHTDNQINFNFQLNTQEMKAVTFQIIPMVDGIGPSISTAEDALKDLQQSYRDWNSSVTQIESDHALFSALYSRSVQDLRVLLTDVGYGNFPVAGLPWYAVPFGRDSLITALQMLSLQPEVAKGTLLTMAAYQGQNDDPWKDEQPGKVMHEIRYGELASLNEIPFTPYYGTIDATPLFLLLAAEYFNWTYDTVTLTSLLPHIERALDWIQQFGDLDGDHFVEYHQQSSKGIANQGWKDSSDSIVHSNGDFAKSPIALVEVQGYVYQAKVKLSPILRLLGKVDLADQLKEQAQQLKVQFESSFWMPEENYYAIALDRDKQQVKSVTSNPGHLLMSGMLDEVRAKYVAERLISKDLFSGYGIRTMSSESAGYNPMSYHDGSIWPHDNSISLLGLSLLGYKNEANHIIEGLLESARSFESWRLPELFCGFDKESGRPVPYPVACSPQAWAAATSIVFLQTMLGLRVDAISKEIHLDPFLPNGMDHLYVNHMKIASGELELIVNQIEETNIKTIILHNTSGYKVIIKGIRADALSNK